MSTADPGGTERRGALRYPLPLPVELEAGGGSGDRWGRLRDYSASGVFLETDQLYAPGAPISFCVTLGRLSTGGPLTLCARGRVTRIERRNGRSGVALAITSYG